MGQLSQPEDGAFFDLSTRTKLRITGGDRLRFLNGQVTNDVRKARADAAIHACVLNAKGKINADVFISAGADCFFVDAEAPLREALTARLERYIIADDVQIEDVSDEFALFHATGRDMAAPSGRLRAVRTERFGCEGTDFWLPMVDRTAAQLELGTRLSVYDDAATEALRIRRGIPRWGNELTEEIIPHEANLEASTIDYAKGCYIGQEVISRMKMSGQTNKRLCGLVAASGGVIEPGMRLFSSDANRKDVGWLTTVSRRELSEKQIALGFVKRGYQAVGAELEAVGIASSSGAAVMLKVFGLPFA